MTTARSTWRAAGSRLSPSSSSSRIATRSSTCNLSIPTCARTTSSTGGRRRSGSWTIRTAPQSRRIISCSRVMRVRGYPVEDIDQRAADISVEYPELVGNYRSAHDVAVRQSVGEATTEDLRNAMRHYRALFNELLETGAAERLRVR